MLIEGGGGGSLSYLYFYNLIYTALLNFLLREGELVLHKDLFKKEYYKCIVKTLI